MSLHRPTVSRHKSKDPPTKTPSITLPPPPPSRASSQSTPTHKTRNFWHCVSRIFTPNSWDEREFRKRDRAGTAGRRRSATATLHCSPPLHTTTRTAQPTQQHGSSIYPDSRFAAPLLHCTDTENTVNHWRSPTARHT